LILLQAIHVGLKLRKLRRADHAIAPNYKWRTNLKIPMLARVQLDHEIDQSAFELRTCAGKTNETAPAQFRRPFEIEEIQSGAERNVIGSIGQFWLLAPTADDPICAGILANWNARMRQVWNVQEQVTLLFVERVDALRETGDLLPDFSHFSF